MPAKPKLSAKAKKAVGYLDHIEKGLLTVEATVGSYVREVQELRQMFEGTDQQEEAKT